MTLSTPLQLVLDTNVVLDWLVFNDPSMEMLTKAVQDSHIALLTHTATLDELQRVLNYPALKLDAIQQATIFARYKTLATVATLPANFSSQNLLMPPGFPQCRDQDDQLFLALALHTQADALVSRDKAVLTVGKRATRFGVKIMDVVQMQAMLSASTQASN